jgi:hypothetical protein
MEAKLFQQAPSLPIIPPFFFVIPLQMDLTFSSLKHLPSIFMQAFYALLNTLKFQVANSIK